MEDQIAKLVDQAWGKFQQLPPDRRLLIAIGGIPGSGKTTLSAAITTHLNARYACSPGAPSAWDAPIAAFVPMDGFHLTRAQLSAMPNPAVAHARRGAEFTFDGEGFLKLVQKLREPITADTGTIMAPSFDHATKDPVEDDIPVERTQRIVVFEGNYVLLNKAPWDAAAALMDLRWFVNVDPEVARMRLAKRHVAAGITKTLEEGDRRAVENDLPNGEEVLKLKVPGIHENVESVQEEERVYPTGESLAQLQGQSS